MRGGAGPPASLSPGSSATTRGLRVGPARCARSPNLTGLVLGSMLTRVACVYALGDHIAPAEVPAAGERRRAPPPVRNALTTNPILAPTPCRLRGPWQS